MMRFRRQYLWVFLPVFVLFLMDISIADTPKPATDSEMPADIRACLIKIESWAKINDDRVSKLQIGQAQLYGRIDERRCRCLESVK